MSPGRSPKNVAASVRARLFELSRRRGVEFQLVLAPGFLTAPERQTQWRAFLRRSRLDAPTAAGRLADALRAFLSPVLAAVARGDQFESRWPPGGPWVPPGTTHATLADAPAATRRSRKPAAKPAPKAPKTEDDSS